MANHSLRKVIALSFQTIHQDGGYAPPTKNKDLNTQTKVAIGLNKNDAIDITYWQLADDAIDFFRALPKNPEYKSILARGDGPEFQTCIDALQNDEITSLTFMYAVLVPHLYGKLKPILSKAPKLDPNQVVVKIIEPGMYMGTLNVAAKFFVKLVFVGREDPSRATLFKVTDRSNNVGFFTDQANKYKNKLHLGDCFAMLATPSRQTTAEDGSKHTIFRKVEFIAGSVTAGTPVDPSNDESLGKDFTKLS